MDDDISEILEWIDTNLKEFEYNSYYIDDGLLLMFKNGEIKIKFNINFGWHSYIDDYNEESETLMDRVCIKIETYLIRLNNINLKSSTS